MFTRLGQIIRQKREEAGLTLHQFALITGLSVPRLLDLEQGSSEPVPLELCRRLGQAISSVTGQQFVMQDLWLAWSVDRYLREKITI